jgi:hypothetical protein
MIRTDIANNTNDPGQAEGQSAALRRPWVTPCVHPMDLTAARGTNLDCNSPDIGSTP